jgi:hypothetical protein
MRRFPVDLVVPKQTLIAYRHALMQHVEQRYIEWAMEYDETPRFLYVTIMFNGTSTLPNVRSVSEAAATHLRVDYLYKHFDRAYLHLLQFLLGSNYNRPSHRHRQPIAWVYADLPGSKTKEPKQGTGQTTRLGLHLHAILLIHPETIKGRSPADLRDLVKFKIIEALGSRYFDGVHVAAVPATNPAEHFERMVHYSSALMFRGLDERLPPTDRWDIWPRRRSRKLGQLASPSCPPTNGGA